MPVCCGRVKNTTTVRVDQVLLMPEYQPPHRAKRKPSWTPPSQRCELAIEGIEGLTGKLLSWAQGISTYDTMKILTGNIQIWTITSLSELIWWIISRLTWYRWWAGWHGSVVGVQRPRYKAELLIQSSGWMCRHGYLIQHGAWLPCLRSEA